MKIILVDTTFLIDALRKKEEVKKFLLKNSSETLFTTEINVFETYLGLFANKSLEKKPSLLEARKIHLEVLLSKFQILPFKRKSAIESAKVLGNLIRKGQKIEFRDGLIAGIAISNGINKILTKNTEHFIRIENIETISY
ncbi:type II toxin-antitoxin system VapC family toxin [Promethearchaeum syntrophicum]|uniref:Type II toxin-antitoxin system VapC family toxin n=1 Tax=Promethearchaeum syntrophicum TaxID=2594042 RepID=A0A5B9DBA0_9ARCH|nr:type II toxin-antitoxin system VapC family toxin [Candidatus Prometheoarchaeum syntrophicum]QEE16265.1 tRNA(fMet)-specific endonuclease VapC [Candidatus Prometheoarchaeum syntrophicum]